jgi:hypothetical protein
MKSRYYLLYRKEQGFGQKQEVYRYEKIRMNELHKWERKGWKVIA